MEKKLTTLLLSVFVLTFSLQAQKVKEKEVLGTWKLIIEVDDELDKETEDAGTLLEEVLIKSVSGLVTGIIENIDIFFEFKKDHTATIVVNAYGEREVEQATWYINDNGYLEIEDDDDGIEIDANDDQWKLIDGILVSDEHEGDRNVYMTKVY